MATKKTTNPEKSSVKKATAKKTTASKSASEKAPAKKTSTKKTSTKKALAKKAQQPALASKTATSAPRKATAQKDPAGGLTAAGRKAFREKEGSDLRPGVQGAADTPEKMKRKGSFLVRTFTHPRGPMKDEKGEPTRLALSAHAWGEKVPQDESAAHKLAQKGHKLLEEYHRAMGEAPRAKKAAKKSPKA